MDGSLTTLGYAAGRKATIDVTNLIWQRASIRSFILYAQPQAAWADAWNTIVSLLQSGAIKPIGLYVGVARITYGVALPAFARDLQLSLTAAGLLGTLHLNGYQRVPGHEVIGKI